MRFASASDVCECFRRAYAGQTVRPSPAAPGTPEEYEMVRDRLTPARVAVMAAQAGRLAEALARRGGGEPCGDFEPRLEAWSGPAGWALRVAFAGVGVNAGGND